MTSKDRARQLGTGPITTLAAVLLPRRRGRIPAWRSHLDRVPGRAAPALEPAPLAHRLVALSIIHQASSAFSAKLLKQQNGLCPVCWQVIQCDEDIELHHRDDHHQNNRPANLELLHPNCHHQVHYAPDRRLESLRPLRGVGHA